MKAKYGASKVWVTSSRRADGDQAGRSTLHSNLGLHRRQRAVDDIMGKTKYPVKERWAAVRAIIVVEIIICSTDLIQLFDGVAKAMKGKLDPFGGVQAIFVGAFGQVAPVPQIERVVDVDGEAIIRKKAVAYAFCAAAWALGWIKLYGLTHSHWYEADRELGEFLRAIWCSPMVTDDIYERLMSVALIDDDDSSWKDEEAVMLCCRKKDARTINATRLAVLGDDGDDSNSEVHFSRSIAGFR